MEHVIALNRHILFFATLHVVHETRFPQRLRNLENENSQGKVLTHESHEIPPIMPLNMTKSMPFLLTLRNLVSVKKNKVANDKFEQRDGHGKSRNGHGKAMKESWNFCVQNLWEPQ